jgi:hypothetical protein
MDTPKLSDAEIEERLPVWTILSELFLDTSFGDSDYDRMAKELNHSPYDRFEIERILRTEVSPAFSWNLFQIAGEWFPWSEEEVREIMMKSLAKRSARGWLSSITQAISPKVFPLGWTSIAKRLSVLEKARQ